MGYFDDQRVNADPIGMNQTFAPRILSTTSNINTPGNAAYSQPGGAGYKPPAVDTASIVKAMQDAQNAANKANQKRYDQGLGVLTQAKNQALAANANTGQAQLAGIQRDETNSLAGADQQAISRGLGNTTIRSALQSQVKRRADDARQGAYDNIAQRKSALTLQASNPIADAIFARNDNGPDINSAASILAQIAAGRSSLGG